MYLQNYSTVGNNKTTTQKTKRKKQTKEDHDMWLEAVKKSSKSTRLTKFRIFSFLFNIL